MKNQELNILKKIHNLASDIGRLIQIMEVCGTHTQAISRCGIKSLLPKNIKLISGPGCPVCVTSQEDIDAIVNIALSGVPIATYGDIVRVPGCFGSLEQARQKGAKVFTVYSIEEAIFLQKKYPCLVFLGLGFETTAPMSAWAIKKGLVVFSIHKLFFPALKTLVEMKEIAIDGFICPGHVSTIIGTKPYKKLKARQVIAGFEQKDVLMAIYMLLKQVFEKRFVVENEYVRAVNPEGNIVAYKSIFEVFEPSDGDWRGFGIIPKTGLKIKNKYSKFDAKKKYKNILNKIDFSRSQKPITRLSGRQTCICGEIIRGLKNPHQCSLFKKVCTPETPVGPCMVSCEGACNVEYRY